MRTAAIHFLSAALCVAGLAGCAKEEVSEDGPPIAGYRTYDLVTSAVKADPWGGQVLLCRNTPVDRRTAFLQLIDAGGDMGRRIDLDALPTRIENVDFTRDELLFTDLLVRSDGSFFVVGIGRQIQQGDRLHMIVHHIDRSGNSIGAPFRRFLEEGGVVEVNNDGAEQDIDGLPRLRALCDQLPDGSLVVAARWETNTAAGVRLFRFPLNGSTDAFAQVDITLSEPNDRLHAIACDGWTSNTFVVCDSGLQGSGHDILLRSFNPGSTAWSENGNSPQSLDVAGMRNAEPQQLQWSDGSFLLVGNHRPDINDASLVKPFVTRFSDLTEVNSNLKLLDNISSGDRPVAGYCAGWWNGRLAMVTHIHEASALQPFFDGDITSDLTMTDLNGDLTAGSSTTVIPGQGLRAIGLFTSGGKRVIIGSQHPFLNGDYVHTYRLEVE